MIFSNVVDSLILWFLLWRSGWMSGHTWLRKLYLYYFLKCISTLLLISKAANLFLASISASHVFWALCLLSFSSFAEGTPPALQGCEIGLKGQKNARGEKPSFEEFRHSKCSFTSCSSWRALGEVLMPVVVLSWCCSWRECKYLCGGYPCWAWGCAEDPALHGNFRSRLSWHFRSKNPKKLIPTPSFIKPFKNVASSATLQEISPSR